MFEFTFIKSQATTRNRIICTVHVVLRVVIVFHCLAEPSAFAWEDVRLDDQPGFGVYMNPVPSSFGMLAKIDKKGFGSFVKFFSPVSAQREMITAPKPNKKCDYRESGVRENIYKQIVQCFRLHSCCNCGFGGRLRLGFIES